MAYALKYCRDRVKAEAASRRKRKTKVGRSPKSSKVRKLVDVDNASTSTETTDQQADSDATEESSSVEVESREGDTSILVDSKNEDSETENYDADMKEDVIQDPYPQPVLRTDCLYHVSCCVDVPPDEFDVIEEKVTTGDQGKYCVPPDELRVVEKNDVNTEDQVETPEWRIIPLKNIYQLEGTENITDEAYQKRHQKYEHEEKRRKRWDSQRILTQRMNDKLKGKEAAEAAAALNLETPSTFLPNIDNLTHIEVSDTIVVMAFGQPVPHVEPSEFELPWDTGPASSFTRKSHGGRGRQK